MQKVVMNSGGIFCLGKFLGEAPCMHKRSSGQILAMLIASRQLLQVRHAQVGVLGDA